MTSERPLLTDTTTTEGDATTLAEIMFDSAELERVTFC